MCALGLFLAMLLLEDMFVGNYSTSSTRNQYLGTEASYNIVHKDLLLRKNITKRSIGKQNQVLNFSTTSRKLNKKIHAGKFTQKQYEIINMLWKKTKIFVDYTNIYTTTKRTYAITKLSAPRKRANSRTSIQPATFSKRSSAAHLQTTTTSKIEFYYMDDMQYSVSKENTEPYCKSNKPTEKTTSLPFLIFHLKGPYVDPIRTSSAKRLNHSLFQNERVRISAIRLNEVQKLSRKAAAPKVSTMATRVTKVKNRVHERLARVLPNSRKEYFNGTLLIKRAVSPPTSTSNKNIAASSYMDASDYTTIYDKIKFFETYDKFTRTTCTKKRNAVQANNTDGNIINDFKKILLQHVDQGSHGHVLAKHEKKHITESFLSVYFLNHSTSKSKVLESNEIHKKQLNETYFIDGIPKSELNSSNIAFSYVNETARWSEYPFAAVYIYEPSQVHCDAAAINTHWLIASGSCLSRVSNKLHSRFEPFGEGQSAFVAYCGEQWWDPERVTYVKYTIVHPKYHSRDKTRQHLYNIGAIQVVNSMISSCAHWAPVALMSHQFAAKSEATWATALGWGLDRFDTRYGATDLPKTSLMVYKSVVYFDSCPGNVGYSKTKRLDDGGGVRNVHCLSLPPYSGEDADPVHGGLLLADGKLIGFYLQEERRPWGEQSAQYTGIWRLIPWIMEIAKVPEEIDAANLELY